MKCKQALKKIAAQKINAAKPTSSFSSSMDLPRLFPSGGRF
jgi:hypothetical protein